jgi:poly(A) polymerase
MDPLLKIKLPDWAVSSSVQKLFGAFPEASHKLRFVGGCVRDTLLQKPVGDIDLATSYTPEECLEFLQKSNIHNIPTGLSHGTVTAVVQGQPFQITTLRKDIESFGRKARVEFTDNWLEDAKRRDFTFNALYLSIEGDLYDPFDGYEDLKKGFVSFIGLPSERIQEDYLRILRFFRFYAFYGKQSPDPSALKALEDLAPFLEKISGERIYQETMKLLSARDPQQALNLMVETKVLEHVLQIKNAPSHFSNLITLEEFLAVIPFSLRRFFCLLQGSGEVLKNVQKRLKLSRKEERYIAAMERGWEVKNWPLPKLLYFFSPLLVQDLKLIEWSRDESILTKKEELENKRPLLAEMKHWEKPIFPLKGDDFLKLGYKADPMLGRILDETERWWVDQSFKASKDECLTFARSLKK